MFYMEIKLNLFPYKTYVVGPRQVASNEYPQHMFFMEKYENNIPELSPNTSP